MEAHWVALVSVVIAVLTFAAGQLGLKRKASVEYVDWLWEQHKNLKAEIAECHADRKELTARVKALEAAQKWFSGGV